MREFVPAKGLAPMGHRGIWSFWSAPFSAHTWLEPWHVFASWIHSVESLRPHVSEVVLHADSRAADWLERLGVKFDAVETNTLDELSRRAAKEPWLLHWWALGKLLVYARQDRPFLHMDFDAYLWKPLSEDLQAARLVAQNPEFFRIGSNEGYARWYNIREMEEAGAIIPIFWQKARRKVGDRGVSYCLGIVGGTDHAFFRGYGEDAATFILDNEELWRKNLVAPHCVTAEQWTFSAKAIVSGVDVATVVPAENRVVLESHRTGYFHLQADLKRDRGYLNVILRQLEKSRPGSIERCRALAASLERDFSSMRERQIARNSGVRW